MQEVAKCVVLVNGRKLPGGKREDAGMQPAAWCDKCSNNKGRTAEGRRLCRAITRYKSNRTPLVPSYSLHRAFPPPLGLGYALI